MNVTITYTDEAGDRKEIEMRGCREEDWQGLVLHLLYNREIDEVKVDVLDW